MTTVRAMGYRERKRIILGLVLAAAGLLGLTAFLLIRAAYMGGEIIIGFVTILGILTAIGLVAVISGFSIMLMTVLGITRHQIMVRLASSILEGIMPLCLSIGKTLGISQETILGSYVGLNNALVKGISISAEPSQVLILAPHCLQFSACPHKITVDSRQCVGCGRCKVQGLNQLAQKYGTQLAIVTGGSAARILLKNTKPKIVIAIACERDLSSGIQDSKIPVIGIGNIRPNGPCYNTDVDLSSIELAIQGVISHNYDD